MLVALSLEERHERQIQVPGIYTGGKVEIVLAGLRGDRTVRDVCREREIAETLYHQWRDRLLEGGKAALSTPRDKGTDPVNGQVEVPVGGHEKSPPLDGFSGGGGRRVWSSLAESLEWQNCVFADAATDRQESNGT